MSNLMKKIKGFFNSIWNSTPGKIAKAGAYVAGGLLLVGGLLQVLTYTVTSFRSFTKAFGG